VASYVDSFTDTNGVLLENHTPDSPTPFTWTKRGTDDLLISSNCLVSEPLAGGGAACRYTADVDPYNSDEDEDFFEANVIVNGSVVSHAIALCLIVNPAGPVVGHDQSDGYRVVLSKNLSGELSFSLGRLVGGGVIALDFTGIIASPADGTWPLRLTRNRDTGLTRVFWQEVEIMSATDLTYGAMTHIGIDASTAIGALTYVLGSIAAGDPVVAEPEPEEECFPDETEAITDPDLAAMVCDDEPAAPSFLNHGVFYEITPGDECIPVGVVAAACWEVGDGTQVGDGSGICAAEVACTVVLSDTLEDVAGTLLEDHVPVGSPTPFTWSKQGSQSIAIRAGNKLRSVGSGTEFYRASVDVGSADCCVKHSALAFDSAFQNALVGVSARHTAVDGLEGIYFGVRSGDPADSVRLFGWDENGDDLFVELSGAVPDDAQSALAEYQLVCEGTTASGYVNGELVLEQTGLPAMAGEIVGLVGGFADNGSLGTEDLYSSGPFEAGPIE
jgi:hypothetical protein